MFSFVGRTCRKLLFFARRKQLTRELAEEMDLHLQLKQSAALKQEPHSQVDHCRREMGNLTLAEESRDMWGFVSIENVGRDIRYALRRLRRNRGFTAVAVLSLAIGIAGNTAIFSLINNLLIRPLPFREPDRLVRISGLAPKGLLEHYRQHSKTMDIAFVSPGSEFNFTGEGPAVRISGSEVSANSFSVLGVPVERGRSFEPDADRPGKDAVVIVSNTLWEKQFHRDPDILARTVTLNGIKRRVIGLTSTGFSYPSSKIQFWIPATIDPGNPTDYWGGSFVPLIARLRAGVTLAQARNEIHSLAANVWTLFPWPMPRHWNAESTVISLQSDLAGDVRSKLFVLLGAVGVVLLIACANVASLLLARVVTRRKEVAMRAALGAGTGRIVRQLMAESIVLSLLAGSVGVVIGTSSLSLFRSLVPSDLPGSSGIALDWNVCLFAAAISLLTGLTFGIAPALSAVRFDLIEAIRTGGQRSSSKTWVGYRRALIAGEIALTVLLVIGAGLLMKSLYDLTAVQTGFNPQHVLTMKVSPDDSFCTRRESCAAFYDELLRQARAMRGASVVAAANTIPFDGALPATPADVEDHPRTAEFPSPMLWTGAVTPDYFRLLGIHLVAGRLFAESDGPHVPAVTLISSATAKRFWPGTNPVGKHIRKAGEKGWRTIVGVVADVRQFNLADQAPSSISGSMYIPYAQAEQENGQIPVVMNILVKTTAAADNASAELRRIAVEANPNVPVGPVLPLAGLVGDSISGYRSTIWVFLSFAGAALVLAAVGLYGLMSYSVSQRTYEISVRMAIGARAGSVLTMILGESLRITLLGMVTGLTVSSIFTRLLSSMLFGVTATDPVTFGMVSLLILIVAAASTSVPAWRAARINPIKALRSE